jgi:hypothetical protein
MPRHDPTPNFDQRPGDLEATRDFWPVALLTHGFDGWYVSIINGQGGVTLTIAEARRLRDRLQAALAMAESEP